MQKGNKLTAEGEDLGMVPAMHQSNHIIFILTFTFFIFFGAFKAEAENDKEVLKTIRKGNVEKLEKYIKKGLDINGIYKGRKLLHYAIRKDEFEISKVLIEAGADIDAFHDDRNPLIEAVHEHNPDILEYLIAEGAQINLADSDGNTALTHAVNEEKLALVKILFESGASSKIVNNRGKTPFEYVNRYHENPVLEYINKMKILHHHVDTLTDMHDGPHVQIQQQQVKVEYFIHDSLKNKTWKEYKFFDIKNDKVSFEGFAGDTNTYHLDLSFERAPSHVQGGAKVFFLGDIHGMYAKLTNLLRSNRIVDSALNWNFGKGHLVFTGDVFDRGDRVTETLWLIHELKYQARKSGGDVHYLLGNHEIMALKKDYRYLASKYLFLSQFFFREYSQWYDKKTYMGRWIRTKNVTMKMDHKLIVHAGFSPRVLNQKLPLEEINKIFQLHLKDKKYKVPYIKNLLVSGDGPVWYRGYVANNNLNYTEVEKSLVDKTLKFYNASKLIVGHMPNYTIKTLYDNHVYLIDVPVGRSGYLGQGLLFEDNEYYKCSENGKCVKIE